MKCFSKKRLTWRDKIFLTWGWLVEYLSKRSWMKSGKISWAKWGCSKHSFDRCRPKIEEFLKFEIFSFGSVAKSVSTILLIQSSEEVMCSGLQRSTLSTSLEQKLICSIWQIFKNIQKCLFYNSCQIKKIELNTYKTECSTIWRSMFLPFSVCPSLLGNRSTRLKPVRNLFVLCQCNSIIIDCIVSFSCIWSLNKDIN
jgi:hypothetical protein